MPTKNSVQNTQGLMCQPMKGRHLNTVHLLEMFVVTIIFYFLCVSGLNSDELSEDSLNWHSTVQNYWSLLSPLIFSDHPKRPGDEDPSPFNTVRNVLDMNAHFSGFNMALLESKKSVWVMNVIPTTANNHLPSILDRGLVGVSHDW